VYFLTDDRNLSVEPVIAQRLGRPQAAHGSTNNNY
jgi:hypothetical protein